MSPAIGTDATLDDIDAALAAVTPDLDGDDRALVRATFRALATGDVAPVEDLAAAAGLTPERVQQRLSTWPGVFRGDDGAVVGFWGIAIAGMPHRLRHDGADSTAWCAWDPLFLGPALGELEVATDDPVSGETITYRLADGQVEDLSHPDSVVSFLDPGEGWEDDVVTTFCHFVLQFTSRETGERWVAEHPDTFLLSFADALELGRRHAGRIAGV